MWLMPAWKQNREKEIKIRWSKNNARLIREAKAAIRDAKPEKALALLTGLQNPQIDEQLILLNNRLTRYRRENIHGIQAFEEKDVAFNRISASILSLINIIEQSLAEEEKEYKEVKDYLRQRYQHRLNQKLAGRQPINLRRLPSTEGTSEETSAIFMPFRADEIRDEIGKSFQDAYGRLLIVGKPGAGKTVLLLQLELSLLDTELDALPVILNLASWQSSFGKLENWLEKVIPAELGVNNHFAKNIAQQYRLILLLDGLDEVKEEYRTSCMEAIGRYGADAKHQYVIVSRIEEYKSVVRDAPVYAQIEVGPLTIDQVEVELERVGYDQPEALGLLQAIRKDSLLQEIVKIPFYFNTLQLMFAEGKRLSDFDFSASDQNGRQKEIFEQFIENALAGQGNEKRTPAQEKDWLAFLSYQMTKNHQVVFELTDLQYDWWYWDRSQLLPAWLVAGLIGGVYFGLYFGLFSGLIALLIWGSLYSLIVGFIIPFVGGQIWISFALFLNIYRTKLSPPIITMDSFLVENERWSFRFSLLRMKRSFFIALFFGILLGVIITPFFGLLLGLLKGVIVGLIFWLFFGLGRSMEHDLPYNLQINQPYQRFRASMRTLHFSILQHGLLRYQLYRQGLLPLRLVDFLNKMTKCHLMESDGATWRFRHQLIQNYFAGLWNKE